MVDLGENVCTLPSAKSIIMIWKFELKKFKTKPAFYEVRRLHFKIQKDKVRKEQISPR